MALCRAVWMIHARGNLHARDWPLIHGGGKGLLRRFFGEVEVTDKADQGGDNPAPIRAIQCFNGFTAWNDMPDCNNFLSGVSILPSVVRFTDEDGQIQTEMERRQCDAW